MYELACHPGCLDHAEIANPRLLRYHHWKRKLAALTAAAVKALLAERGIRVVGYRDVEVSGDRLVPRDLGRTADGSPVDASSWSVRT